MLLSECGLAGLRLVPRTQCGLLFHAEQLRTGSRSVESVDHVVSVLNRTYRDVPNLTVDADIFSLDSKLLAHQSAKVSLAPSDVKDSFSLADFLTNSKEVNFVVLNLKDAKGNLISHNAYWLAADNNYTALQSIPRTEVATTVLKKEQVKTETVWSVKFTNNSKKLAFFVNPRLMKENEEVLPAYWSANYFHWHRANPSPAK